MASLDAPRTRRSFARLDKSVDVPNLIDIQRRSFAWLTDPNNLLRLGEMIGGGALILLGIYRLFKNKTATT